MRGFGTLGPKRDVFIKPLPIGVQGVMWKRMQEERKGQSGCRTPRTLRIFQTQQDSHTRELTETEAAHTHRDGPSTSQMGPSTGKGKQAQALILNSEAVSKCQSPTKESSLLQWSLTGNTHCNQEWGPCPAIDGQLKMNSTYLSLSMYVFFFLFSYLLYYDFFRNCLFLF